MKRKLFKTVSIFLILTASLAGCSQNTLSSSQDSSSTAGLGQASIINSSSESPSSPDSSPTNTSISTGSQESNITVLAANENNSSQETISAEPENGSDTELIVQFGQDGTSFTMHLYDNETAAAIARHVGTASWQLPIYHYDDYDNWEVMQYYDIPSRYEIPSNPERIASEAAGTVYYSEPNRIVLFFHEAEVSGEYTPVGYFDDTDEFVSAVENNPVLEGWGNKLVFISPSK
jgi:hypothetical protein